MFFSIVIPLYNKEKYISRTIESVLNQTHKDFELVIVNDGSIDNSANIVRSFNDKRIKLIDQPNGGVSKARNNGVRHSKAEWVAFLDADDEYEINFLSEISLFIEKYKTKNISFIGSNYFISDKNKVAVNSTIKDGVYDYFSLFSNQKSPNDSSTTVVKKVNFIEVGGFPEGVKQFEDWITWFKLAFVGDFGYISKPLGIYNYIEDSVSHTERSAVDFFNDAFVLVQTIKVFINKYDLELKQKKRVKKTVSEFSINIALILSHKGSVFYAIKMLMFSDIFLVVMHNKKKLFMLIIHLIVPNFLKNKGLYSKIKKRLSQYGYR